MKPTAVTAAMIAFAVFVLAACKCQASLSFIGTGYVELQPNGSGNQYYWVNQNDGSNPQFSGNLGGLTINQGQNLMLGGQVQTYPDEFGVNVLLHYAIDQNSSFSTFNLNYKNNTSGPNGNNDLWDTTAAVNINSSLSDGTHTLYVWYSATDGSGTLYDNNGGLNYSATFTVVPEPIRTALGMFAGLAILWWGLGLCWKKPEAGNVELE